MQATYAIAHAAGWDAGNASMRAAGRTAWNEDDWNAAAETMNRLLGPEPDCSYSGEEER